jgi:type I restriction enzyme, S subunit
VKFHQLTSVLDFQGGSQPPKKDFENEPSTKNVRFLQIRDFKTDNKIVYIPISKKNRLCKKEDILIARYGASVGQILTGKEGAYNVALMKVIDSNNLFNVRFLNYFFNSPYFQNNLLSRSTRSAQAGFNKGDLSEIEIPVPPLQEQEKIVERLDKIFENIDAAAAAIDKEIVKYSSLKKSILNKEFSYE